MKKIGKYERSNRGEQSGRAKLTEDSVREIRKLRKDGVKISDLALTFGVNDSTIKNVVSRLTWTHVGDAPKVSTHEKQKSEHNIYTPLPQHHVARVQEYIALKKQGWSYSQIGEKYGLRSRTVYTYVRRYENTYGNQQPAQIVKPLVLA